MDKEEFAKIMAGLHEVYTPGKEINKEKIEIYWRIFKAWPLEKLQQACNKLLLSKKISTFPLPAEIAEAAMEPERSLHAWLEARKAVAKHGPYMHMVFDDPVIHSVIEAMGDWPKFCNCPDKDRPWRQKEFERFYNALQHKAHHPEQLQGLHDDIPDNIRRIETGLKRLGLE